MTSKAVTVPTASAIVPAVEHMQRLRSVLAPGEELGLSALTQVGLPAGGGKFWDVDGQPTEKIYGVVLLRDAYRAYWERSFDDSGGGEPPNCSSEDLVTGIGEPGGECQKCPLNQWESAAKGSGKACQEKARMFVAIEGSLLPLFMQLPLTSALAARAYALNLAGKGLDLWDVVTEISLEPAKSAGGINYSVAKFKMHERLEDADRARSVAYRDAILPGLQAFSRVAEA